MNTQTHIITPTSERGKTSARRLADRQTAPQILLHWSAAVSGLGNRFLKFTPAQQHLHKSISLTTIFIFDPFINFPGLSLGNVLIAIPVKSHRRKFKYHIGPLSMKLQLRANYEDWIKVETANALQRHFCSSFVFSLAPAFFMLHKANHRDVGVQKPTSLFHKICSQMIFNSMSVSRFRIFVGTPVVQGWDCKYSIIRSKKHPLEHKWEQKATRFWRDLV